MLKLFPDVPNTDIGAPSTEFGSAKNDVVPGDESGTPLIEKWLNDLYYGFYATIFKAGLTPSGTKENTSTSDFFNALKKIIQQEKAAFGLNPTPQDTPNNTVKLAAGVTRDPNNPIAEPVLIAAGAADALTVTGVTADTRMDRLVHDKAGVVTKKVGVQSGSPVPPALVSGESPICRMVITTIGTPVLDNVADLIIDERPINELPKLDVPAAAGKVILAGRVNANGTIANTEDFGTGFSFSVVKSATGTYDVTLVGLGGFTNVHIIPTKNINNGGSRTSFLEGITDKSVDTGFGTPSGFRSFIVDLKHDTCGSCPFMDDDTIDEPWSFVVIGID